MRNHIIKRRLEALFLSFILGITCISVNKSDTVKAVETEYVGEAAEQKFSTEELKTENLPDELIKDMNIEDKEEIVLSDKDAEELSSVTVVNDDNTETAYLFPEPVKYVDEESGEIKFIDNTIEETSGDNEKYAYESTGNSFEINYAKDLSDGVLVNNGDYSFEMKPIVEGEVEAELKDIDLKNEQVPEKTVEYGDAFGEGEDVQYESVNRGLKESILVEKYSGRTEYEFMIHANGLEPDVMEGTEITFMNSETEESVFTINPTFVEDSFLGSDGESHISYDNSYKLKKTDNGNYLLTMIIDKKFMEDSKTVYPVIIDPTIMVGQYTDFTCSYVLKNGESKAYMNGSLWVGSYADRGEAITYVKAKNLAQRKYINPDNIISTVLYITDDSPAGYTSSCKVNLYDSNTTAAATGITYNTLLSKIGSYQSSAAVTSQYSDYTFDITYLSKQWIKETIGQGGFSQNYGFILRADQGASAGGRRFDAFSLMLVMRYSVDELCEGIYNIKNVQQGNYLSYTTNNKPSLTTDLKSSITQWKVTRSEYGAFYIQPVNVPGLALCASSSDFTAGTAVTTGSNTYKKWRITKNNDGSYRVIPGSNETMVNTALAYNSSTTTTCLQGYSNASNQKWVFEPVLDLSEFYIKSAQTNKNLSLTSQNYACAAAPSTTLDNQRWSFVKQSDGTYMIFNSSGDWSTRAAGATYGKNYIGTESSGYNVKMTSNGSKKWRFVMNHDTTCSFVNENGNYLTLNSDLTSVTAKAYDGTAYQKWTLETAKKDISVGGMYDKPRRQDLSDWVTSTVISACYNIGCNSLNCFNKGSNVEVLNIIKTSSVFAIMSHGDTNLIVCNANNESQSLAEGERKTEITSNSRNSNQICLQDLPDNCFSTTRLIFLGACSTAGTNNPNLVTAFSQKGVQTVVGFKDNIVKVSAEIYMQAFMKSLGRGQNLGTAFANGEQAVIDSGEYFSGLMSEDKVILGNTDMTATFCY